MAELEQAIVCGTEWHRDGSSQLDVESFRHWPGVARRYRAQGCMRAHSINCGDLLPYLQVRHLRANLDNLAASLVANHVRLTEQRTMPAIERVAALDAYSLDANADALRMAFGIGNILVLQDFRTAILIVNRSLHNALLIRR